tara:strand:+ start:1222 stop:2301 length:1080 start_codon:yes stop_codon:yes gene_type:complete
MKLNDENQQKILDAWNSSKDEPPSLMELTELCFGEGFDGRSKEGRAVKDFLATRQLRARASDEYQAKGLLNLTKDQEEFIDNNLSSMKAVEIAKVMYRNEQLTNLSQETRTVAEYIKNNSEGMQPYERPENVPTDEYKPPKTIPVIMARVNKYVLNGIDKEKLSPKIKKDLKSLIGYLHTFRFNHQINSLAATTDRELFESSFIRYTFDKGDLTQEEVDQYIVLATEVVIAGNIQARIEHLQGLLDDSADDTEGRRIAMSLVEAISSRQTEYNQSVNRQQKLLNDLKVKRSDRIKQMSEASASVVNLVEMWKEEESRKQMIQLAELRKEALSEEINKLSDMDEIKSRIMGISEDEVLNG